MKKLAIFFIALITQSFSPSFAFESIIPDGGYQGRLAGGDDHGKVHLLIQANPGCEGCFTAIAVDTPDLNSPTVRMVAYTATPWDETYRKFALTPMNIDSNGELTHPNDDPSLILDISSASNDPDLSFTVTPSGSNNLLGYTGSMLFKHRVESPFKLEHAQIGEYRYWHKKMVHERRTNAVISWVQQNNQDRASEVSMQWFGGPHQNGGSYNLREKFPGVYSFNPVSFAATGKTITERLKYIVIFASKRGKDYILMVNPNDSKDVLCLILK